MPRAVWSGILLRGRHRCRATKSVVETISLSDRCSSMLSHCASTGKVPSTQHTGVHCMTGANRAIRTLRINHLGRLHPKLAEEFHRLTSFRLLILSIMAEAPQQAAVSNEDDRLSPSLYVYCSLQTHAMAEVCVYENRLRF